MLHKLAKDAKALKVSGGAQLMQGLRRQSRRRYVRPFEERCSFYVNGDVVLVVKENTIATVIPRSWL